MTSRSGPFVSIVMFASVTIGFAASWPAGAQTPPPATTPPVESRTSETAADLEPGVDTSSTAARARETPPAEAAENAAPPPTPAQAKTPAPRGGSPQTMDRLELESTQITGNRELPKVLYIVPWKQSDLGDLIGKPANSLVDEILAPVDRDTFRRETRYYEALAPDGVRPASQSAVAPEK